MKKLLASFLSFFLVFSPFALAQTQTVDPGWTPDQPIRYGLDRAWDQMVYLIASINPPTQANYGLKVARERIAEAKLMAERGMTQAEQDALENAERMRNRVRNRVRQRNMDRNVPSVEDIKNKVNLPERARGR